MPSNSTRAPLRLETRLAMRRPRHRAFAPATALPALILAAALAIPGGRALAQADYPSGAPATASGATGPGAANLAAPVDEVTQRIQTEALVSWRAPTSAGDPVEIRIVGINDLHGYLEPKAKLESPIGARPVGGAAVLASYIHTERMTRGPKRTLTLVAGDSIGASAPVSGFLRDEPTMAFLNLLADGDCKPLPRTWPATPSPVVTKCRTIATVGNHEFDKGVPELERLLYGGKHPDGALLGGDWKGMRIPYVVSNVVRRADRSALLPSSALVDVDGVKVGVVGAVTLETATLVSPSRIADVQFLPEAQPVNAEVAKLRAAGAAVVVLVIHEGLQAPLQPQPFPLGLDEVGGRLKDVLAQLDPGIDVIVSGHSHKFTNALVGRRSGAPVLVTQARQYGVSFSTIDLTVDRETGQVVAKSARILTPWGDAGPGLSPDRKVEKLVAAASKVSAQAEARPVGTAGVKLTRARNESGESVMGNLVADSQRDAAGTDFAFMNMAGMRNDIDAGPITYGELYSALPFGNVVSRMTMTGEQILRLLEQQWSGPNATVPRVLHASGLRYTYDLGRPVGRRIVDTADADGLPIDANRRYTVAANDFLVAGGDNYSVFAEARDVAPVMVDREALEKYIAKQGGTVSPQLDGRSKRLDAGR